MEVVSHLHFSEASPPFSNQWLKKCLGQTAIATSCDSTHAPKLHPVPLGLSPYHSSDIRISIQEIQAMKSLPIPSDLDTDPEAIELLRVWAAHSSQHISIATQVWKDPANWGIMLVDLAKHIALAYELETKEDREKVLARIREGFDVEWEHPTDNPQR